MEKRQRQFLLREELLKARLTLTVAAIFFSVELILVLHRHFAYYPSYSAVDQGIFDQVFWNSLHGNFFQSSLSSMESISLDIPTVSYHRLGQHFTPALLLWLPFYALFPAAPTLLILSVALMTAAGIVLYFLARTRLDSQLATLIALGFYGSRAVIAPTLGNFQDLCQLPLFLFGLFLALEKQRWLWFWLLAALVLAVREDAGILLFSVGIYLLLSRRQPLVGLVTCLLSFTYAVAITTYVMPLFSLDVSRRFLVQHFGKYAEGEQLSSLEVLWALFRNPWRLLVEIFTPFWGTLRYLLGQWLALAFIPAISLDAWLLVAAPLLVLLLRDDRWALALNMRFALTVVPGLFYGTILWWSKHPKSLNRRLKQFWIACIWVSLFLNLTSNPHRALSFLIPDSIQPLVYASPWQQWQQAAQINALLQQVPADASIAATASIIPHVSNRREVVIFPDVELKNDSGEIGAVEYAIADLRQLQQYQIAFSDDRERLQELLPAIARLLGENTYGVIGFEEGILLLKKGVPSDAAALAAWQEFAKPLQE